MSRSGSRSGLDDLEGGPASDGATRADWARRISLVTAAGLVLWSLLGITHMTVVLLRPSTGWRLERDPGAARAVGLPLEGAHHVTETMDLMDAHVSGEGGVWFLRTPDLEDATWQYLLMQLAHLAYPRPVELMEHPSLRRSTQELRYGFALRPHDLGSGWTPVAATERITLFRREP
jgi:hypothetical protein